MAPPSITLYDVPSAMPEPWAPNIWRIRFILNYKRLPYRTVWIEFHDVERTLRSINAPPTGQHRDGRPIYSLPVIVDPSRSPGYQPIVLSQANAIAEYLEATYPARPVFPDGSRALQIAFVHFLNDIVLKPLLLIMVPLSHFRLPERSQAHFHAGSQPPMPGHLTPGPQREQAWLAVKEKFDFLAVILDKNRAPDGDGIVAMGRELSYADFAMCSVLIWVERVAPHDGWARMRQWGGGRWARLWERCKNYMDAM
ncbi:hypothetical protein HETIRDRAFT_437012 [Heterobasidion irregulare TC 32-1]|uniref:GST N-terminal domain-containing protein n=1 Tax=Heterobasidion irregulare (strain TC 32-1) TaxID=747525 RepID=W4JNT7_HETIT|nr:uncharacterized protein HETIRDRAFT_437012 [Heterobasidion irregulare TC 32-1]ETW75149.1 hypothetical protein HETIRDRAFT_437012 [Heterobasidion irregulare TC 32-1]